ncbi:hypothetical protein [Pseudomonas putida]|uniref:Uncharacterized protein n=1 Tax=Pseudomonas putida TaxID=303 RepID=A0A1B2F681_PSEPU|nr:hypothetical protein [Pseudomonas putida]ANY87643.1 hypothetical protein IEC33019_2084 [Pseudomonas putida]
MARVKSLRFVFVILALALALSWLFYFKYSKSENANNANNYPEISILGDVIFKPCEESKYYHGSGVEALNTDTIDDYLASTNSEDSSVCFEAGEPSQLSRLKMVWYSESEAPKHIEVIGVDADGVTNVMVSGTNDLPLYSYDGVYYSDISIDSDSKYKSFIVNYISGASQDRLLLRALSPFFKKQIDPESYDLLKKAKEVSLIAPYGPGVTQVSAKNADDLAKEFREKESLHCGNYSYILAHDLGDKVKWKVIAGTTETQAMHTVVEVEKKGKTYTVDPTLGAIYKCSYSDMRLGTCDASKGIYSDSYNPIFWQYAGENFYPGVRVGMEHVSIQGFYDDFKKIDAGP